MSKLRVAYVINDANFFVSHRLPLALSVIKKGGNVTVITGTNINIKLENEASDLLKKNNISHKRCNFSQGFTNTISEILGLFQLVYFLRKFKPTTIHSVTAKGNFMALISLIFFKRIKFIMSVSGLGTMFTGKINFKKKLFIFLYKMILKFFLLRTNYNIIFQNNDDYNQFKSLVKINSNRIEFVSGSGVDTSYFLPKKSKSKQRNILLPARMLYEKGINEFVEAAIILNKRKITTNFFLAGDMTSLNPSQIPKEKILSWVKSGIINYLDYQKDMRSLYNIMDIVCLPSWREGFPKVLMEAASCGIPTITTDVPGCRHAIINNKTGFLVPLKDPISLADAIENLIQDESLQERMGNAGRVLALKKFDLKIIIPQIVNLYE